MLVRRKICLLLPLIAGLCACAGGDGRYPTLAMRPFETAPPTPSPVATQPTRPVADSATIAALVERASLSHAGFARQEKIAARLARTAAGQSIESEARAAALVAMADLASQRAGILAVLAELDLLAAEAATTFAPVAEIDTARQTIAALVGSEDAAVTRLWETLGQ